LFASIDPSTGAQLAEFAEHDAAYVEAALERASKAQKAWARTPIHQRVELLRKVAAVLRERKERYGKLITQEMGKPIAEAEGEVEKCAWNCEFYAESAPRFLADETVASGATDSQVVFDPLGIVLAVMPWNYPFWQMLRFAAPALAAGNGAVLKHASNVPQCAMAIEEVFRDAGAPAGLMTTLLVGSGSVRGLIEDRRIAAVTLTGSTPVGKQVASQAGAVMKKQVLELGGSDPFIVLADADVELAAKTALKARFQNVGQSCIAAKRFIVDQKVADRFVELLVGHVRELKTGNPLDRSTTMGPMARGNLRAELHAQVEKTVAEGGKVAIGGKPIPGPGFFYEPTVLDHVTPRMTAAMEETFGPVAAVIRVKDTDEAIAVANEPDFGLGAALWSKDVDAARVLARRIEAGAVFINGMVASDPRLPFGGIKQSGYGRELGSYGIHEFVNIKTVWIGPAR
jgi:succinate-semialdehyde dehydrogenase/glutarate-semialdehyde dehydrogenase